jgi:hypothetical protein
MGDIPDISLIDSSKNEDLFAQSSLFFCKVLTFLVLLKFEFMLNDLIRFH